MPIKVIDKATQSEVEVSSREAEDGIVAGRFVLPSASVKVTRGYDESGTVSADKLSDALAHGWALADDSEADAAVMRAEEGDASSAALGALESAAAGATLGLSTALEEALGVDPARMRARREGLGGIGTGLEVAGALAPALLTGGASAGASAGAGAARAGLGARSLLGATPAGLLARGGAAVERGLGAAVGTGGLARTVVPVAGRGLVEGFAAGVGQEIDESVLGERDLTAERLLASGGMGALLGGATGALVPGVAYAGTGLGRVAAKPIRGLLGRAAGYAEDVADGGLAKLVADPRAHEVAAKLWGVPVDEVRLIATTEPDRLVQLFNRESTAMLEELGTQARPVFEGLKSTRRVAVERGAGEARQRVVRANMPTDRDALARISQASEGELARLEGVLASEASAVAGRTSRVDQVTLNQVNGRLATARRRIGEQAQAGMDQRDFAAFVHGELDDLKRGLDEVRRPFLGRQLSIDEQATRKWLDDTIGPLRGHLGDEKLYGAAGALHAERNNLMSAAIRASEQLTGASRNLIHPFRQVDNADLLTVMRNGGTWRGQTKTENLLDYLNAENDYLAFTLKHGDLDDAARKAIDEQIAANKSVRQLVDERADQVRKLDVIERWRNQAGNRSPSIGLLSTPGPAIAGLLGGAVGGLPGAAIGAMASTLANPYTTMRKLAQIMAHTQGAERGAIRALGGVIGRLGSGASAVGSAGARGIGEAVKRGAPVAGADRASRMHTIRATAQRLASNPSLLADEQRKMSMDLEDVAPRLAKAVAAKTAIAVGFLASKTPAAYAPPMSKAPPMIDPIDLETYERYVEAVTDPVETLSRVSNGTLTAEHVEALKAVWPEMYREAQQRVFAAVASYDQELPLDVATQLSVLFEAPVDPLLPLAGGIQASFASGAAQAQAAQQQATGRQSKPPKLEIDSSRYDSPMDAATKASHA